MSQLSDYVKTQLANGFSKEQIAQALSQQGYTQENITQAFADAQQTHASSFSDQYFQQLYNYVQTTLAGGYPANQLYSYLIQQGYDKKLVDGVFTRLHNREHTPLPQNVKHEHEISSSSITKIGVMLVVLILVGGGLFFLISSFSGGEEKIQLFELEISLQETVLLPGDTLRMQVSTVNEGDIGLIETQYKFVITDSLDRVVTQWEKAGGTQTRRDFTESEVLPDDMRSGTYSVAVIAYYGAKSSRASRSFKIVNSVEEQEASEPIIQEEKTTQETTTQASIPSSSSQTSPNPQITKPSTTKRDTDDDLLQKATRSSSAQEAGGYCSVMQNPSMASYCYTFVAETYNDYAYCSQIQEQISKEDCYITFLLLGDSSVCSFVQLHQNVALCNEFTNLDYFQMFYETGDQSYLEQASGTNPDMYIDQNFNPDNIPDPTLDDLSITDLV
jgi:hypothetical protein